MRRITTWMIGPVAALCAAGAAMPAVATEPTSDCPSHGVLLDAAALCETIELPLRQLPDFEPGRNATAASRTGRFAAVRAMASLAPVPADGRRPLAMTVEPDASAAPAAPRQQAAREEAGR